MAKIRAAAALATVTMSTLVFGLPAIPVHADCSGPMMEFLADEVERGGTVPVTGRAWGTQCYDTGPPPAGEGVLGPPIDGIEIVFVGSDGSETVVARGGADSSYSFAVDVQVPTDATPGTAGLSGRWTEGEAFVRPQLQLTVREGPPVAPQRGVASFGPQPRPSTSAVPGATTKLALPAAVAEADDSEDGWKWYAVGAVALAAIGGGFLARRRVAARRL